MTFIISDAILGLSLTKFLLHLLNFAILFVALWLILYKPVMKFIRARQERIDKEKREAEEDRKAAEAARLAGEERLNALDEELENKRIAAEQELQSMREEQLNESKAQADEIVKAAELRAKLEADKIVAEAKAGIKDAAVTLAQSIIEEKIDKVDDALIDSALKDWKKNG